MEAADYRSALRSWSSQNYYEAAKDLGVLVIATLHWAARYWVPNILQVLPGLASLVQARKPLRQLFVSKWSSTLFVTRQAAQVQIYRATMSVRQPNIY